MNVFRKVEVSIDRECYTLFWADVWAIGLARKVRVVIAAMNELNLSVGSIKTLMHNASILEYFR